MLSVVPLGVLTAAERPLLAGLKRVAVTVTADPAGGLDAKELQSAVDFRLRQTGLRIDPKSRERLKVTIGVSHIQAGKGEGLGYAYSIHLGVSQQVNLADNPAVLIDALTWEGVWLGIASRGNLQLKCAQGLSRRLDEFVAVYQAGLADEDPPTSRASVRR